MAGWIRIGALHTLLSERAAQAPEAQSPEQVRAMATASDLFLAAGDPARLADLAAGLLALEPGQMCLLSLAGQDSDSLRPVAVAHATPTGSRRLRRTLSRGRRILADAFSRKVFGTGGALRMTITSPRLLRLWLPEVYWPYVERSGVSAVLAAALRDRDRVIGALLLWRERGQPAFTEADEAYVTSLAARLALGLSRA